MQSVLLVDIKTSWPSAKFVEIFLFVYNNSITYTVDMISLLGENIFFVICTYNCEYTRFTFEFYSQSCMLPRLTVLVWYRVFVNTNETKPTGLLRTIRIFSTRVGISSSLYCKFCQLHSRRRIVLHPRRSAFSHVYLIYTVDHLVNYFVVLFYVYLELGPTVSIPSQPSTTVPSFPPWIRSSPP